MAYSNLLEQAQCPIPQIFRMFNLRIFHLKSPMHKTLFWFASFCSIVPVIQHIWPSGYTLRLAFVNKKAQFQIPEALDNSKEKWV